jgi:hypothetical protein
MIDRTGEQSPVRNQGDRGTCVAFAVSAAHEWVAGATEGRSAEDAMWAAHEIMTVPGKGEETSVSYALQGLETHEHAAENSWPYGNPRWQSGRTEAARDGANRLGLPKWRRLPDHDLGSIHDELVLGNAIVLTIGVVRAAWLTPKGQVDAAPGEKVVGNHAVLVVGASEEREVKPRLKVKNSWGRGWGENGFGTISKRYLEVYGICTHAMEA